MIDEHKFPLIDSNKLTILTGILLKLLRLKSLI